MGSRWRAAAVVLVLAALGPASAVQLASAHPDRPGPSGEYRIPPASSIEFPVELHFHRLVGDFAVTSAGGSVSILLIDEAVVRQEKSGTAGADRYIAREASAGKLNVLIACCVGASWSAYRLRVENRDASRAVTVRLRTVLIHDGFAVFVYDAERGAAPGAVGIAAALALALGWPVVRRARVPAPRGSGERGGRAATLGAAAGLFAAASLLGVLLAVAGAQAFGGGPIEGFVASAALLHFLVGTMAPTFVDAMLLVFLLWAASLLLWARAVARAQDAAAAVAGRFGLFAGGMALALGALVAATYGAPAVPALFAAIVGAPLVGAGVLVQRASRSAAVRP